MKIIKKIKRILLILRYYIFEDECAFLHLVEEEALEYLDECKKIGTCNIEEVEDLLFHIQAYFEIPEVVKQTMFKVLPDIQVVARGGRIELDHYGKKPTQEEMDLYVNYLLEVQRERAVERDFICEHLKTLPIGIKL